MIRTNINAPFDHVITQDVDTGEVLNLVVDVIGSEVANAVSDDMAAFIAIAANKYASDCEIVTNSTALVLTKFLRKEFADCREHALNTAANGVAQLEPTELARLQIEADGFAALLNRQPLTAEQHEVIGASMMFSIDEYEGKDARAWDVAMAELGILDVLNRANTAHYSRPARSMKHKGVRYII